MASAGPPCHASCAACVGAAYKLQLASRSAVVNKDNVAKLAGLAQEVLCTLDVAGGCCVGVVGVLFRVEGTTGGTCG